MRPLPAIFIAGCLMTGAAGLLCAEPARAFRIGVLLEGSLAEQAVTAGQVAHREALSLIKDEVLALTRG